MKRDDRANLVQETDDRGAAPVVRRLAAHRHWGICEYVCSAGPGVRPFEERHDHFMIAAVVEGSFTYRSDQGRALLHSGAFLLGNHGRCFECGHDHTAGDRCIAIHFTADLFEEIAATAAGSARYAFKVPSLPALKPLMPIVARLEAAERAAAPFGTESAVIGLAEAILAGLSGHKVDPAPVSARDERRISAVLRHIEHHADEPLDLDRLCAVARLSKYHFLRVFRRIVGLSPYQFLLTIRMRRAAVRLATSSDPVATAAYESGFGDLSTFSTSFRQLFGMSPGAYRRRNGIRA